MPRLRSRASRDAKSSRIGVDIDETTDPASIAAGQRNTLCSTRTSETALSHAHWRGYAGIHAHYRDRDTGGCRATTRITPGALNIARRPRPSRSGRERHSLGIARAYVCRAHLLVTRSRRPSIAAQPWADAYVTGHIAVLQTSATPLVRNDMDCFDRPGTLSVGTLLSPRSS